MVSLSIMHKPALIWFAAELLTSACAAQQLGFHVVEPAPGRAYTSVTDLSQSGTHAIVLRDTPAGSESLVRDAAGLLHRIPLRNDGSEWCTKISGDGTMFVGGRWDVNDPSRYSIIRHRGGVTDVVAASPSLLFTVNGDGDVITGGELYPISLGDRAVSFRWTPAGKEYIVSPNDPEIMHSQVFGSSADGRRLCGGITTWGFEDYAFAWSEQTGVQRLTVPTGTFYSSAYDMSSDGRRIVGTAGGSASLLNLMWIDGAMTTIGNAPDFGRATHVSNSGVVVCESSAAVISVWTQTTGMMLFRDYLAQWGVSAPPELSITTITAISDDGNTISGRGRLPNGQFRGFIVTVPAPGATSIFLVSFVACRRRR